jgi:hypothetical protein
MLDMSYKPATHDLVYESRKTQQKDSLLMGIHENTTYTHRTNRQPGDRRGDQEDQNITRGQCC